MAELSKIFVDTFISALVLLLHYLEAWTVACKILTASTDTKVLLEKIHHMWGHVKEMETHGS